MLLRFEAHRMVFFFLLLHKKVGLKIVSGVFNSFLNIWDGGGRIVGRFLFVSLCV